MLALSGLWFCNEARPQAALAPTPDQLELFRNLPADQQQSLVKQLSGVLGGGTGSSGSLGGLGADRKSVV